MRHLRILSRQPEKGEEFTTGQKLTLAAGIIDAVAGFFALKEDTGGSGET